jgi:hypothetical protein
MTPFLALLALLAHTGTPARHVRIPEPDGVVLDAALVRRVASTLPDRRLSRARPDARCQP